MAALWEIEVEDPTSCPSNASGGDTLIDQVTNKDVKDIHKAFAIITLCYIPFIIVGNTLIIGATYTYKKLRTPKNFILSSLAVADLSMAIFCIPMYATSYLSPNRIRDSVNSICLLWFASIQIAGGCSLSSLLLITIDRHIAVFMPDKYDMIMSPRRTQVCIFVLWSYNILIAALPALGVNNYDSDIKNPYERCNYYKTLPLEYVVVASFFHIGFNIGLSFILNVHVFCVIARRQTRLQKIHGLGVEPTSTGTPSTWSNERVKQFNEKVKTVRLSFVLFSLYILFWIPYLLVGPLKYVKAFDKTIIEYYKVITQLFNFFNAVINAPIYAYMRTEYRVAYRNLLKTNPLKWHRLRRHTLTEIRGDDRMITGWSRAEAMAGHSLAWNMANFLKKSPRSQDARDVATTSEGPVSDSRKANVALDGVTSRNITSSLKNGGQDKPKMLTPRFSPSTKVL